MATNRKRNIPILFWVSEKEKELIEEKMEQLGTSNLSAYLRKIAIDGYVFNLDMPELRNLVSLLRQSSNNLNQLTRRVYGSNRIYAADLESLRQEYDKLWDLAETIMAKLAVLA